ncbi:hypothetical protein FB451DRAFT_1213272 [Mycena latifolia]|nr:hypothetical protein FB451DRAFT_1213272 [Mycena latifolia]
MTRSPSEARAQRTAPSPIAASTTSTPGAPPIRRAALEGLGLGVADSVCVGVVVLDADVVEAAGVLPAGVEAAGVLAAGVEDTTGVDGAEPSVEETAGAEEGVVSGVEEGVESGVVDVAPPVVEGASVVALGSCATPGGHCDEPEENEPSAGK